jgi:hypothetical protein
MLDKTWRLQVWFKGTKATDQPHVYYMGDKERDELANSILNRDNHIHLFYEDKLRCLINLDEVQALSFSKEIS